MPGPSRPPSTPTANQTKVHHAQGAEDIGIQPLDNYTRHLIRASLKITSLSDLVVQLLRNAVHKGKAKRVKITVNPSEWRVECEDDGAFGFSRETLESLRLIVAGICDPEKGGELREANARKHHGGTLCSAATLGKVEIWSRSTSSSLSKAPSATILMLSSSGLTQIYDREDAETHGMTMSPSAEKVPPTNSSSFHPTSRVIVRDLFHNLPVRRSAAADPHSSNTAAHGALESSARRRLMLVHIRHQVKLWSMAMPFVTIELYEEDKMASSSGLGFLMAGRRKRLLKLIACGGHLKRFSDLLENPVSGHATAVEIGVKHGKVSLEGCLFIDIDSSLSKSQRYVFANGSPIEQDATLSELVAETAVRRQQEQSHSTRSTDARRQDLSICFPTSTNELPLLDCVHQSFVEVIRRTELVSFSSVSQSAEASDSSRAKRRGGRDSGGLEPRNGNTTSFLHYFVNIDINNDAVNAHARKEKAESLNATLKLALKAGLEDGLKKAGISVIEAQKTSEGRATIRREGISDQGKRKADATSQKSSVPVKRKRLGDAVIRATKHIEDSSHYKPAPEKASESEEDESEGLAADAPHAKWRDPTNGQVYLIDRRTGSYINPSLLPAEQDEAEESPEGEGQLSRAVARRADSLLLSRRLQSAHQAPTSSNAPPEWLSRTLSTWENPVFADPDAAEHREEATDIPALSQTQTDIGSSPQKRGWDTRRQNAAPLPGVQLASRFFADEENTHHGGDHACKGHPSVPASAAGLHSGLRHQEANIPFSRQDMKEAEVIAQVDRKFISCLLPTRRTGERDGRTLAFIDQHAADERVRVERFFAEYLLSCRLLHTKGVASSTMKKPLLPSLRKGDINRLLEEGTGALLSEMLTFWGFSWTIEAGEETGEDAAQSSKAVRITSVPKSLHERLAGDASTVGAIFAEVLELDPPAISVRLNWMRQCNTTGDEELVGSQGEDDEEQASEEVEWLSMLRHAPPTIRRLLESKACRGAIMFNDTLSTTQCQDLIQQLSRTLFPFQCAHGRPAIMPLCEIANLSDASAPSAAGSMSASANHMRTAVERSGSSAKNSKGSNGASHLASTAIEWRKFVDTE